VIFCSLPAHDPVNTDLELIVAFLAYIDVIWTERL